MHEKLTLTKQVIEFTNRISRNAATQKSKRKSCQQHEERHVNQSNQFFIANSLLLGKHFLYNQSNEFPQTNLWIL